MPTPFRSPTRTSRRASTRRVPERERAVIVMSFYDEQPSDAVGTELGLTAGNVRVIRHRGIDRLRRCVDAGRRAS